MRRFILCLLTLSILVPNVTEASRKERRAQAREESEAIRSVRGGARFDVANNPELFQSLVTYLKIDDYALARADKDAGEIATEMEVTGKWRQTGTRVLISLIELGERTTVKVAVTEQKRFKALQTEPWGEPKVAEEMSADLADDLERHVREVLPSTSD